MIYCDLMILETKAISSLLGKSPEEKLFEKTQLKRIKSNSKKTTYYLPRINVFPDNEHGILKILFY